MRTISVEASGAPAANRPRTRWVLNAVEVRVVAVMTSLILFTHIGLLTVQMKFLSCQRGKTCRRANFQQHIFDVVSLWGFHPHRIVPPFLKPPRPCPDLYTLATPAMRICSSREQCTVLNRHTNAFFSVLAVFTLRVYDRSFRYASRRLSNQLPGSFRQPWPHLSPDSLLLFDLVRSPVSSAPLSPSIIPQYDNTSSLFHSHLKTFSINPSLQSIDHWYHPDYGLLIVFFCAQRFSFSFSFSFLISHLFLFLVIFSSTTALFLGK